MHSTQNTESSPSIAGLERMMAARPQSPLFTRLAAAYIEENRPAQALKLCLQGLRQYPDYPTALLLVAKSQVMLRQYSDARESLDELLRFFPGCPAARALLERMTELELEYPPYTAVAASSFAASPVQRRSGDAGESQWSRPDNPIPGFDAPAHAQGEETPTPTVEDGAVQRPSDLDLAGLASRLESARIPALPEEEDADAAEDTMGVDEVNLDVRPVTETLIAIYVQQGKLREAIDAYRRLAERHPDRREEFEARVGELESRLQQS